MQGWFNIQKLISIIHCIKRPKKKKRILKKKLFGEYSFGDEYKSFNIWQDIAAVGFYKWNFLVRRFVHISLFHRAICIFTMN